MDQTPAGAGDTRSAPGAGVTPVSGRPESTLKIKSLKDSGLSRGIGIRLKLLLGFGLTSLVVGGLTFLAVRERVRAGILDGAVAELVATRRAFLGLMDTQYVHLEAAGRLIADAPKLRAAVETRDPATVQEEASWFRTTGQADLLAVLDPRGGILAFDRHASEASRAHGARPPIGPVRDGSPTPAAEGRTVAPARKWAAPSGPLVASLTTLAREALEGRSGRGLLHDQERLYLTASVPITILESETLGVIVIGLRIDERLTRRLHAVAQAQVAFLVGSRLVAASFPGDAWEEIRWQIGSGPGAGAAGDAGSAGGTSGSTVEMHIGRQQQGQRHLHLTGRFQPSPSSPVLTYVLLLGLAARDESLARLEQTMLTGGAAFLAIVMIVSGQISRRLTRGIEQLARSANEMAEGNFQAPMESSGSDEVSYLAHAMRELRGAVSAQMHRLSRINESLRGKIEEILFNETLGVNYDQVEIIGRGGMGIVYRARNTQADRTVAIKVLSPLLAEHRTLVNRFLREAEILARLQHPGLIRIYQAGQTKLPYCEMEYFPGLSLHDLVRQGTPLPWSRALPLAEKILDTLAYVHSCGILHRDIKPSNILVGEGTDIRIIDFGLALDESLTHLTHTGEAFGTPDYVSPEQESGQEVDVRADIFSAGLTIHYMLSGRAPRMRRGGYEPVAQVRPPDLPDPPPSELDRVLSRAASTDLQDRYGSCIDFRAALSALSTLPVLPAPSELAAPRHGGAA